MSKPGRKFNAGRQRESKTPCSLVMIISWFIILAWLLFLFFSWRSGLLKAKIPSSLEYVENSLRGGMSKLQEINPLQRSHSAHEEMEKSDIHVVFSTDCSPYQDWQVRAVLLFRLDFVFVCCI
jgi:hypothetical protein